MKITTDVLSVLSLSATEGNLLRLPPGQLDRKLYKAVDNVLQDCGGKWNRSKKAHVFDSDAAQRIEVILATGEVTTAREVGFFPTPFRLAADLVEIAGVQSGDHVLEPSAGDGAIVKALLDIPNVTVTAVERDPKRRVTLAVLGLGRITRLYTSHHDDFADFVVCEGPTHFDRVVMNPPFCKVGKDDHLDHVRHAFSMLKPRDGSGGGVLVSVLPSSVTFREDKRHVAFRDWVLDHGTIEALPDGSFKESGTDVRTCVVRMVKA